MKEKAAVLPTGSGPGDTDFTGRILENIWRNRMNFEGAVGLEWSYLFSRSRRSLTLAALYEVSYWPDLNCFIGLVGGGPSGPPGASTHFGGALSYQGGTD